MVKIRLKRFGKKHQPFYRVVIMPARSKRNGAAIEELGTYDPLSKDSKKYDIDFDRVKYWLSVGAQPTDTLKDMLVKEKILPRYTKKFTKKKLKKEKSEHKEVKQNEGKAEVKKDEVEAKVEQKEEKTKAKK